MPTPDPKLPKTEQLLDRVLRKLSAARTGSASETVEAPIGERFRDINPRHTDFLRPHSEPYFSLLNPVFLHQMRPMDFYGDFSQSIFWSRETILARDGLLSLIYFFTMHPTPPLPPTLLLVHERASIVVPKAWSGNTAFYRLESSAAENPTLTSRDFFLLITVVDECQSSEDYVKTRLDEIRRRLGKDLSQYRFHLVISQNPFNNFNASLTAKTDQLFMTLKHVFGALGSRVENTPWTKLQTMNISGGYFWDVNEFNFYFSDSAVVHHLMARGAKPFFDDAPRGNDRIRRHRTVDASLNHRYVLSTLGTPAPKQRREDFDMELNALLENEAFFAEFKTFAEDKAFTMERKFCPRTFEELAFQFVKNSLNPRE